MIEHYCSLIRLVTWCDDVESTLLDPLSTVVRMGVPAVLDRVRGVAGVRASLCADRAALEGWLRSIAVVRSWLASAEVDLAARLAACASFPEQAIAEAGRGSQSDASRVLERSGTLGSVPALADALDDGSVTPGHVDAVTKTLGRGRTLMLRLPDGTVPNTGPPGRRAA